MRTNRNDIYVSPAILISLFDDTRKEVGDVEIFTSRKYKVLREAWIASMFSFALSMHQGGVWWLRPNPEDVAPDFYAFNTRVIPGEEYKEGINTEFEVFEWGKWSKSSLLEATIRKVSRIHAPKMSIIGYAAKENQPLDFEAIHAALKKLEPNVLEVWILAKIKQLDAYVVMQVYPYLFPMPVPSGIPKYYVEPYGFVAKYKGKLDRPGGRLSINDQLQIRVVDDTNSQQP